MRTQFDIPAPVAAAPAIPDETAQARACPLCGGMEALLLRRYSPEPWRVVQCTGCDFVFLSNIVAYHRLVNEFAWDKQRLVEQDRRSDQWPLRMWVERKTRWRLRIFARDEDARLRRLFARGRVLDVGCGAGNRVPEPFVPYGIEISETLWKRAASAMSARGGEALHGPAIELLPRFPDGYFNGVVLRSYLEHETQPRDVLQEVRRALRPDGKVFVRVPNYGSVNRRVMGARWCGFRYPDHVNYFTAASLRQMAAKCGLRMRTLNALNLALDDNIKCVLTKA